MYPRCRAMSTAPGVSPVSVTGTDDPCPSSRALRASYSISSATLWREFARQRAPAVRMSCPRRLEMVVLARHRSVAHSSSRRCNSVCISLCWCCKIASLCWSWLLWYSSKSKFCLRLKTLSFNRRILISRLVTMRKACRAWLALRRRAPCRRLDVVWLSWCAAVR